MPTHSHEQINNFWKHFPDGLPYGTLQSPRIPAIVKRLDVRDPLIGDVEQPLLVVSSDGQIEIVNAEEHQSTARHLAYMAVAHETSAA